MRKKWIGVLRPLVRRKQVILDIGAYLLPEVAAEDLRRIYPLDIVNLEASALAQQIVAVWPREPLPKQASTVRVVPCWACAQAQALTVCRVCQGSKRVALA